MPVLLLRLSARLLLPQRLRNVLRNWRVRKLLPRLLPGKTPVVLLRRRRVRLLQRLPVRRLPRKQDRLARLQRKHRRRLPVRLKHRQRQKLRRRLVLLPRLQDVLLRSRLPVRLLLNRLQEKLRLTDRLLS